MQDFRAESFIASRLFGKTIDLKRIQPSKAFSSIVLTPSIKITEVTPLHRENASIPIVFTMPGIVIVDKELQPLKEALCILRTPVGMLMDSKALQP